MLNSPFRFGVIAQLVERLNGIEEVWGSNPHGSTPPRLPKKQKSALIARLLPLRLFVCPRSPRRPPALSLFVLLVAAATRLADSAVFLLSSSTSSSIGRREALEPRPNGNFRIGVEPRCQRLDGVGSNAALVDTQQEVFEERSWDVPALNLWHYEPE